MRSQVCVYRVFYNGFKRGSSNQIKDRNSENTPTPNTPVAVLKHSEVLRGEIMTKCCIFRLLRFEILDSCKILNLKTFEI